MLLLTFILWKAYDGILCTQRRLEYSLALL